jgi:hypothetical protein
MGGKRYQSMPLEVPDQAGDLPRRRHALDGLLREDQLTVDEDIELARAAPPDPRRDVELALQIFLEAHGLPLEIPSEEAALDLNVHR